jgi:hypothetical protein
MIRTQEGILKKLEELDRRIGNNEETVQNIFTVIKQILNRTDEPRNKTTNKIKDKNPTAVNSISRPEVEKIPRP